MWLFKTLYNVLYVFIFKVFILIGKCGIRVCVSKILVELFKYKTIVQITISWRHTSNAKHGDVPWNGFTLGNIEVWYKK